MTKPESSTWIDISVPVTSGMVHWPGDPLVQIERVADLERGDPATVSKISMGVHTGTHMDAPLHFIPGGQSISMLPLDATVGRARVIEIPDSESIKVEEIQPHDLKPGERVLFKTKNSVRCWQGNAFTEDFVFISKAAAQFIAERRVRMVGVDYLSVGGFKVDGAEIHRILLRAGVWIIEGLNLAHVRAGEYELICLPLRLEGAEGAPARAILKPA